MMTGMMAFRNSRSSSFVALDSCLTVSSSWEAILLCVDISLSPSLFTFICISCEDIPNLSI
jgi:hypothetical protein